jgi:amino acid permease
VEEDFNSPPEDALLGNRHPFNVEVGDNNTS